MPTWIGNEEGNIVIGGGFVGYLSNGLGKVKGNDQEQPSLLKTWSSRYQHLLFLPLSLFPQEILTRTDFKMRLFCKLFSSFRSVFVTSPYDHHSKVARHDYLTGHPVMLYLVHMISPGTDPQESEVGIDALRTQMPRLKMLLHSPHLVQWSLVPNIHFTQHENWGSAISCPMDVKENTSKKNCRSISHLKYRRRKWPPISIPLRTHLRGRNGPANLITASKRSLARNRNCK